MVVFANIKTDPENFNNTGNRFCTPYIYYKFPFDCTHRCIVGDSFNEEEYPLVLGGGGMFQGWFIDNVFPKFKNKIKIVWGSGTNYHHTSEYILPEFLNKWDMVGVRDKETDFFRNNNIEYDWVPCVSCKNELFDISYTSKHDIVIYEHLHAPIDIDFLPNAPKLNNIGGNLEEKINFIGSGDIVITNSYHGAYWGLLLNKKVIIYKPFANRYLYFPWDISIAHEWDIKDTIKSCTSFNILQECREANDDFYQRVCNLILN